MKKAPSLAAAQAKVWVAARSSCPLNGNRASICTFVVQRRRKRKNCDMDENAESLVRTQKDSPIFTTTTQKWRNYWLQKVFKKSFFLLSDPVWKRVTRCSFWPLDTPSSSSSYFLFFHSGCVFPRNFRLKSTFGQVPARGVKIVGDFFVLFLPQICLRKKLAKIASNQLT